MQNNLISMSFKGVPKEDLACFSKINGVWKTDGCKLVLNRKSNSFNCYCELPNPTTITDDLTALINNKNLKTAFGSQGLENISNFTDFYKYVVFWSILCKTIFFIILFIKGKRLDSSFFSNKSTVSKNKIFPENTTKY